MWSKQAETRNKNMTSFKNKITNRKRKNSKSAQSLNAQSTDNNVNVNSAINNGKDGGVKKRNSKYEKNNKLRSVDSCSGKINDRSGIGPDLLEDLKQIPNKGHFNGVTTSHEDDVIQLNVDRDVVNPSDFCDELDAADVILRSAVKCDNNSGKVKDDVKRVNCMNSNLKRYSDSFVIENGTSLRDHNRLSRAVSGFLVTDIDSCDLRNGKVERKTRRFSDLFRAAALKTSTSCENLKELTKMIKHDNISCKKNAEIDDKNNPQKKINTAENNEGKHTKTKRNKKYTPRSDNTISRENSIKKSQIEPEKIPIKKEPVQNPNNSYLKRVRSRIYKNKHENSTCMLPTMPDISEGVKTKKNKNKKNSEIKNKPTDTGTTNSIPDLKKSVTHFDFRLIRQTSNLERIRPKTFGPKKSSSNAGISDLVDDNNGTFVVPTDKPVLAKSKSSSAINLNLLRSRRNKILENYKKSCKTAQNEFDFIAFGKQNTNIQIARKFGSQTLTSNVYNTAKEPPDDFIDSPGETKPGHPVSRTGSDRRPDAVREESSRTTDGADHVHDKHEEENAHQDSSVSLPAPTGKRKPSSNINRSESVKEQSEKRKQRRNISDPLHNNTSEHIELDQELYTKSGSSSSNSSLSSNSRLSESPSNSVDAVPGVTSAHQTGSELDSDMEVEADPPDWQSSVPADDLASLPPHEKKRQDIINELFHTERSHVRNLRVLDIVFMKPLCNKQCLKQEELNLLFPNLSELLEIHAQFNNTMKTKRKESPIVHEIGDILLDMFDGSTGERLQNAAATFCERQQLALELIKEKRRKDSRFEQILSECEKNLLCRRLPLQGIIPTEMQRLSKYPLLLERLIEIVVKSSNKDNENVQAEIGKLRQAHDRSKEILNHVNEAAKIACNRARLEEIQRHLDTSNFERTEHPISSEFKNLDLTRYKLIHEGTISLRRPNKGPLQVHMVLLEEAVILLQKEGERYLLKFFQTGTPSQQPLSPIIKMSTLLVRTNAASKSSLFLVNTSTQNSQMYDLLARDSAERKTWFKHLSDAAEAYNRREGKSKRSEPTPDTEEIETVQDLPSTREVSERAETVVETPLSVSGDADSNTPSSDNSQRNSDIIDENRDKRLSQSETENSGGGNHSAEVGGGGAQMKLAADDWPLIQPSEVQVAESLVLTAESTLTPLEQIRRKDEEVRRALADKEGLVADLLSIPREDFPHIADMASEQIQNGVTADRDSTELVLAAVYQVNQLIAAVNDSLNISEADAVLASGGKHPSCASNENSISNKSDLVPAVPVHKIQEITTTLNKQLTTLLSAVKQADEERDRLRKELHRTREQLHEKLLLHGPHNSETDNTTIDSTQSGDLESIEESPTEN